MGTRVQLRLATETVSSGTCGGVAPGAEGFAAFLARLGRAQGDDTVATPGSDGAWPHGAWTVRQTSWRLMAEREALAPAVFDAWNELWIGAALAHDRWLRVELVGRRDMGDAAWEWRITRRTPRIGGR